MYLKEVEGLYYPYSENKGAQLICAFVFTHAKSRVSHDALKLNILPATTCNINVFCTSQFTINTFMQDLQVHWFSVQFSVSGTLSFSPWFYQGAEGYSFVQGRKGIRSNQSFFG